MRHQSLITTSIGFTFGIVLSLRQAMQPLFVAWGGTHLHQGKGQAATQKAKLTKPFHLCRTLRLFDERTGSLGGDLRI